MAAFPFVLFATALARARGIGGWRCEVCQDVAATFRSQFPSLGDGSLPGGVTDGSIDPESLLEPVVPRCEDNLTSSQLRFAQCKTLRSLLGSDTDMGRSVWTLLSSGATAYSVCESLAKCQPSSTCSAASSTHACQVRPDCAGLIEPACGDACASCVWLMRAWPRFQGICSLTGGRETQVANESTAKPPAPSPQAKRRAASPSAGALGFIALDEARTDASARGPRERPLTTSS